MYQWCIDIVIVSDSAAFNQGFKCNQAAKTLVMIGFPFSKNDRSQCSVILGIIRNNDELFKFCFVVGNAALIPESGDAHTPALL